MPGVEGGVVLAFPCPFCQVWRRPRYEPGCGCYVCRSCHHHAPAWLLQRLYVLTRSFMPDNITYN